MLITQAMRALLNVPQEGGFLVQKVANDSPASKMGLQPSFLPVNVLGKDLMIGGDIVLRIQGITIEANESLQQIQQTVSNLRTGDRLTVQVLRAGRVISLYLNID